VAQGDLVVGALGTRYATLEVTGGWEQIEEDGQMYALTSAGLFGQVTSKSPFCPDPIPLQYRGHVCLDGRSVTMRQFVPDGPYASFSTPIVLLVGTSMSAGKTTTAKIIVRQLKRAGFSVLGAKLTGAGRYRDILGMSDAGADWIFDFVDVGLPSTVCKEADYRTALDRLLGRMGAQEADVAVIEIGASPMEPYNGDIAYQALKKDVRCTILCASDPYAVYGVMKAYQMIPDVVGGIATNTRAGIDLIEKLCQVPALNVLEEEGVPRLNNVLARSLGLPVNTFG